LDLLGRDLGVGYSGFPQQRAQLGEHPYAVGSNRFQGVVLPAIRGRVQTGIRVALGIAWVVLVPAEMLGVRSGLGYQVLNARDQLAYDQVVAVIVVIGALGFALDLAARWLISPRETNANAG
jgi:NitT/TauT family transport system permease protein